MMPLIVLYDPEEGTKRINPARRAYAIPSENPMFEDAHLHYWARRAGNPFENLDVLWIPRDARSNEGRIFASILESVTRNIDHMYIWQEENTMGINGHVDFRNWDRRDELEVVSCLNAFTIQNIFLALEMTEQTPFGTSAMQRWYRIWECVRSGIPTIYALPGAGTYQNDSGLGTRNQIAQDTWIQTNPYVLTMIGGNEAVTKENLETLSEMSFDTTPHNVSPHLLPDMFALWDTYSTPCAAFLLPEAYPFICDQYAWSGVQLEGLWDVIEDCINQARTNQNIESQDLRENMWEFITQTDFHGPRKWKGRSFLGEVCSSSSFPPTHRVVDNPDPTNIQHHRGFRGNNNNKVSLGFICQIDNNDWEEVLQRINQSRSGHNMQLSTLQDIENAIHVKNILSNRDEVLILRIHQTPSADYDKLSHTNYAFNGLRYDLMYSRLDSDQDNLGVQLSPYARRATYVLQTNRSLADFTQLPDSALAQYSTVDLLSLSDGLFPGPLWWPRGTRNHRFAPCFAEVAP